MKLELGADSFRVISEKGETLLMQSADFPMLYMGCGNENVDMYHGNFKIEDYVTSRMPMKVSLVKETENGCEISYEGGLLAKLSIAGSALTLQFETKENWNRVWFRLPATKEERCYGCGEQMSYFNLRGRHFPLWTSEPGVGRDKSTYITWRSDVDSKAGGDYYNTNFPQATFVTTKHAYVHVETSAYADFDFRHEDFHELQIWEIPNLIRIEEADTYLELLEKLTAYLGRQQALPEWICKGIVIGLQGGRERTLELMEKTLSHGVDVSGVWCQDWCGKRVTSFGKRLQWDWKYHKQMYPKLPEMIAHLHERGIRFLGYINPYLVNDGDLFKEGEKNGYFAKHADGSTYLVDFGEFECGVVDLTNPKADEWFQTEVIKKYSLDIGIDGWMADFGEYLPTDDIVLSNGKDPMKEHNLWPVRWAKCNFEAVKNAGKLGDVVYFMRAGGCGSQKYCTLLWAGDQSVDFTMHDGLATVICAALSSGMTGYGISHSDIGGYTSLYDNTRTKELFLRWAEMAVFTPVMRTHEGNRPDTNFQYYDDDDTMDRLARLTKIHTMLLPYTMELVRENAAKGIPVQRPLFLHAEEDENTYDLSYEYFYGKDVLVAPVYQADKTDWEAYLPAGTWVHFWSGETYEGQSHVKVDAPLGQTPAFYRKGCEHEKLFAEITKKYGIK